MEKIKIIPQKEFDYIYSRVTRLCVDMVIKSGNKILLTKRKINPYNNLWHFPGGTVSFKEPLEDAIRRIAKSELNVDIEKMKMIGMMELLNDEEIHPVSIVFLVDVLPGQIKLDFQASEYAYFDKVPFDSIKEHKEFVRSNFKNIEIGEDNGSK